MTTKVRNITCGINKALRTKTKKMTNNNGSNMHTCLGRKLATAIRLHENRGSKQKCDSGQAASDTWAAVLDLRSYSENVLAVLLAAAGAEG